MKTKQRASFQEILERKKLEGNHRVLEANASLGDPEAFKESMRKVREEYEYKSAKSARVLRDRVLK